MTIRMRGPWILATVEGLAGVSENTGVYEIRERDGDTIDIDYAGAREPFGLRSALASAIGADGDDSLEFRCETHVLYMTRFIEVVLEFRSRHGGAGPERVTRRHPEIAGRITPG